MRYYLDASALVKRYIAETGSDLVLEVVAARSVLATSVLTGVELPAALARTARMGIATEEAAGAGLIGFWQDWPTMFRLRVNEDLVRAAAAHAWRFGLRGYDAMHLATCADYSTRAGEPVCMATFDRQLARAARLLGMETLPGDLDAFLDRAAGPSSP